MGKGLIMFVSSILLVIIGVDLLLKGMIHLAFFPTLNFSWLNSTASFVIGVIITIVGFVIMFLQPQGNVW